MPATACHLMALTTRTEREKQRSINHELEVKKMRMRSNKELFWLTLRYCQLNLGKK